MDVLKGIFLEYCNESSIHGMRYLTDKRKTLLERIFWVIFLLFSIVCCCWFVIHLYESAQQSSIVMTIANRPKKISDIVFPAIIVCPAMPFNSSVFDMNRSGRPNVTKQISTFEEVTLFMKFCIDGKLGAYSDLKITENIEIVDLLKKVNMRLNDQYLEYCNFGINAENCQGQIQEVFTNMGVCFSFNAYSMTQLYRSHNGLAYNFSTGLVQNNNASFKPINIPGPYERGKIEFKLVVTKTNMENTCSKTRFAFVVALRSPYEAVVINSADLHVSGDTSTEFSLLSTVLESSDSLRSFELKERECYFDNERILFFLRYYTQENCHIECMTNLTLETCGCVLDYMPRLKTTSVCNTADTLRCAFNFTQYYDNMGFGPCYCYSQCNTVTFRADALSTKFFYHERFGLTTENIVTTFISVFTKEKNVNPLYRSELYGFNDYVANFGGLLGLFLGISILSLIEIFYYIIVRPVCAFLAIKYRNRVTQIKTEIRSVPGGAPGAKGGKDKAVGGGGKRLGKLNPVVGAAYEYTE